MTWTNEELAYTAGIIDGEGTITIRLRAGKYYKEKNKKYHQVVMQISSTDPPLINWLFNKFGGSVGVHRYENKKLKQLYRITWTGLQAEKVIRAAYPYLILKKEQADLVFRVRATISNKRISADVFLLREQLSSRIHKINARGVQEPN